MDDDARRSIVDDDQHERGDVVVGETSAFVAAHVDGEQVLATPLSASHLTHEQRVEHDQRRARNQVHEHDATPEIDAEVDVPVCLEPLAPHRQAADDRPRFVQTRNIYMHTTTMPYSARMRRQGPGKAGSGWSADPIKFEADVRNCMWRVCVVLTSTFSICIYVPFPYIAFTISTISKGGMKTNVSCYMIK